MKKTIYLLAIAFTLALTVHAQDKKPWQELKDFHAVMGATYPPADEGHLEPLKARSQELVDKAIAWEKSTAPEGYDKQAVAASLKKLVAGCKELNKLVKSKAKDEVLKKKITALHGVFHEIQEKCEKDEHGDHH